jgi:hypothetical protein
VRFREGTSNFDNPSTRTRSDVHYMRLVFFRTRGRTYFGPFPFARGEHISAKQRPDTVL